MNMTYNNFVLFLASIPDPDAETSKEPEKIETKDSDDIF